jgi:hypothetical protein
MQAIEAEVSKQGIVKFCQPIQLEGCYRAIVTLVEPIEPSDKLFPIDEELELEMAYRNANNESDSTWECAITDGLSDEAW